MNIKNRLRATILVCAATFSASAMLVACGGGSGGASSVSIGGTISGGAAWPLGTHVVVSDSTGATVCDTTTAADDGIYSCAITATAKAPLVVTATHADKEPLVSVVSTLATSTVNVNPATHAVAALLVNGDPSDPTTGVAALIQTTPTLASPTAVAAQQTAVLSTYTLLAPDAMAAGVVNPFTGTLTTDGKGMDAVLDNVKIVVTPTGSGAATMAVTTTATRDDATLAPAPLVLSLAGNAAVPAPAPATVVTPTAAAAVQVTAATAVASGTTGKINDLLARITACYAEPQATRVDNTNAASAVATNIVSTTCKGLFLSNDPAKYKENSYVVRGNGAFSGIFTNNTGFGIQFSQANYEFTVKNDTNSDPTKPMTGDVVFTAKWVAPFNWTDSGVTTRLANADVGIYTARPDVSGKLFLTGNLSNVDISIEPRAEFRDFTHSLFSKYSYINSGYSAYVNSKHNFGKVVVTTPKGGTLTLKQITGGGYGYMGLSKSSESANQYTAVTTSVLRMAAAYIDPITTSSSSYCGSSSNHPRDIDGSLFWTCDNSTTPKNWTDSELASIPDQGTWKFDLYTNWNDITPVGTTYRRTLRRAPTLAEITLSLPNWPSLTADMRSQITASSAATGGIALSFDAVGKVSVVTSAGGPAWQIPSAPKWAPKNVKIYGKDSLNANAGFDDSTDVYSSWRRATVACSSSGGTDQHCELSGGVSTGNFRLFDKGQSKGAGFGQLQFNGYDARRVMNTLSVNMRKS